jgi:hypothetical protein
VTILLDAGQADETIRPDVDARDVILLIGYLTRLEQTNGMPGPGICSSPGAGIALALSTR